jgi:membrane-associated phospholipid phosphatase
VTASRDRTVVTGSLAVFAGGAIVARRAGVTRVEQLWFTRLNGLSHRGYGAAWPPMQLGSLGGPLAVGAALALAGERRSGARVAAVGAFTWAAAKAVKPLVRRGRPAHTVDVARVLGRTQAGLGYPSGHAAVAAATAALVAPRLPRPWAAVAWVWGLAVGPMRTYVGAHLPLDVVGGAALGIAIGTAARSIGGPTEV